MNEQIGILTQLGTEAVQVAIAEYAQWFVVSSLCWIGFGAACAVIAVLVWKKRGDLEYADAIALVLAIVALLTIPCNLPTLMQPRAYAIHQLIKDGRGY